MSNAAVADPSTLQHFDGPLDLLLDLITRKALDITTISLAAVAEQYLELVANLRESDLERLSAFLVIASRLLLIKSQMLLPRPQLPESEDERSDADDLVRQIEEYRQYKQIAAFLREVELRKQRLFARQAPLALRPRPCPGGGATLDLVSAFNRALALIPPSLPEETVLPLRFTVAAKLRELSESMERHGRVSFSGLVGNAGCRQEVIALFLALLEMLRRGRAMLSQDGLFGDIFLARPPQLRATSEE